MILTFSFFLYDSFVLPKGNYFGNIGSILNRVSHRDYDPHRGRLSKIWLVSIGELPRKIPYKAASEI